MTGMKVEGGLKKQSLVKNMSTLETREGSPSTQAKDIMNRIFYSNKRETKDLQEKKQEKYRKIKKKIEDKSGSQGKIQSQAKKA